MRSPASVPKSEFVTPEATPTPSQVSTVSYSPAIEKRERASASRLPASQQRAAAEPGKRGVRAAAGAHSPTPMVLPGSVAKSRRPLHRLRRLRRRGASASDSAGSGDAQMTPAVEVVDLEAEGTPSPSYDEAGAPARTDDL